jgi:6-phosphogluconolactonase
MSERRVFVHPSKQEMADSVAARFIAKLGKILAENDISNVVLTGGTMGAAVLGAVNANPERDSIDWKRVHFWWGDERWLPRGDPERNETQAREALLDHIDHDESTVHALAASDEGVELDDAALAYSRELVSNAAPGSTLPRFDITFLGVGPDGHIASLFPERSGIRVKDATVVGVRISPKPPPFRLTLTLPVINSSERIWLVLAGADKASALGLTLAGVSSNEVPAAGANGRRRTDFHVDSEATAEVPENLTATEIYWTAADSPE